MIQTFVYDPELLNGNEISLVGSEARHMLSVLRLQQGDTVRLIDGRGTAHFCEIIKSGTKKAVCRIIKTLKQSGEPSLALTLAIGLSTGSKFDTVIEKGVEVGVSRFVPLLTEKSKVKLGDASAIKRKMNRWRRVAEAAVKQSGRSKFPEIEAPVKFHDYLEGAKTEPCIIFHPDEKAKDLITIVDSLPDDNLAIIVGPESGFSTTEIDSASRLNIPMVSLGSRILRTETAGVVLSALLIYYHKTVK